MSDLDLVTNAADDAQVARGRRVEKDRERRRRDLVRHQLSTVSGREFVWQTLEQAGIFADCVGDVAVMAAFLGRRRGGLELLAELTTFHPNEYLLMQQEAIARETRARTDNLAARTPAASAA